jgi:hypothetical protein
VAAVVVTTDVAAMQAIMAACRAIVKPDLMYRFRPMLSIITQSRE